MSEPDIFMSGKGGSYSYRYVFEQLIPYEGGGAKEFALTLLTNPIFALRIVLQEAKLLFLSLILLPCCFLPLLARRGWELLGYGLVFCLLASISGAYTVHTQYSSVLWPFAMVLTPYGLVRLSGSELVAALGLEPRRVRCALLVSVAIAASLVSWKFGALVKNDSFRVSTGWHPPVHFRSYETSRVKERAQYESAARAIELIPSTASVSATRYLLPLVSNREYVRNYPNAKTDYVLVRMDVLKKRLLKTFESQVQSSKYEEIFSGDGIFLLKRVVDAKARTRTEQR
jgi:uncharacterized membrane protein